MTLLTFKQAIRKSEPYTKRHAMLGNGFSIACRPDIFVYGKLFERADFSMLSPSARKAFDALGTSDFEKVIKTLRDAVKLLSAYPLAPAHIRDAMLRDAEGLREVLVKTIASSHPEHPAMSPKMNTLLAENSWGISILYTRSTTISFCIGH